MSDLHHGASSPYKTPRVSLQHGSWGPTASDPREPGESPSAPESSVSLYRLASLGLGGTTWAMNTTGQAHWCQHARYNWRTSSFCTSSHFQCVETRRISEMCWSWGHGIFFRAMGYLHQPVLERPCPTLASRCPYHDPQPADMQGYLKSMVVGEHHCPPKELREPALP